MRAHLSEGGLILAATHGPFGLDADHELRLGEGGAVPCPVLGEEGVTELEATKAGPTPDAFRS
jgi:hypothetical protein